MINKANALKDLDRAGASELTVVQLEDKYRMPINQLIELTGWKAKPKQTQIPTVPPNTEEVVIDTSTPEGQRKLAAQAVTAIIELISPLNEQQKTRVLESVAAYFGVVVGS